MWAKGYSKTVHLNRSILFWIEEDGWHKQMLWVDALSLKDELTSKQFLDTYTAVLVPDISLSQASRIHASINATLSTATKSSLLA